MILILLIGFIISIIIVVIIFHLISVTYYLPISVEAISEH